MKLNCHIVHPAHYHLFKPVMRALNKKGWETIYSTRNKDILENLLQNDQIQYYRVGERYKSSKFINFAARVYELHQFCKKTKPDLIISSSIEAAIVGKTLGIPALLFFEDDLKIKKVRLWAFTAAPLAKELICPEVCDAWLWNKKAVKYNGYHELSYLTPAFVNSFDIPNRTEKKFLIRLSQLNAYHDHDNIGLIDELVIQIIQRLQNYGRVFISAERELPEKFEKYRLLINPNNIFSFLNEIDIYIGDSQTMAAEAAVLGVPSIRFNSFVGKLGYLEELEHKYELTYGIKQTEPERLLQKIDDLLKISDIRNQWKKRRDIMLSEKINVPDFMVWLIENYPKSIDAVKKDKNIQYNFL